MISINSDRASATRVSGLAAAIILTAGLPVVTPMIAPPRASASSCLTWTSWVERPGINAALGHGTGSCKGSFCLRVDLYKNGNWAGEGEKCGKWWLEASTDTISVNAGDQLVARPSIA
jgi:hypothetical protein